MALMKSQVATQLSGSIGGITYTRTRSGMVQRARTVPVQPNSGAQLQVRSALTQLVTRWTETLTPTQRAAWDLYAANVPVVNPLGDSINNTGQNWYIACNVPRLQAKAKLSGLIDLIDDAPTIFNRGDFTSPVPTWTETSGLSTAFTNADAWANEDASLMLLYEGLPQNPARNFFKGPFRLIGFLLGSSSSPPTTPNVISAATLTSLGYTITELQRVWLKVVVSREDGRLSSPRIIGPNAVGA